MTKLVTKELLINLTLMIITGENTIFAVTAVQYRLSCHAQIP